MIKHKEEINYSLCKRVTKKDLTSKQENVLSLGHEHSAKEIYFDVYSFIGSFPMDPTDTLLLLYEFEARAKLNDSKVETVLESVLELENVEVKVLETIAG